jgi:cytoskeletal protein CcmA (bactofilin family)
MRMNRNPSRSANTEASTLGRGISIKGRISGGGDLTIEGQIEGEIAIEGELRVTEQAEVRAKVDAGSATIEGLFEGELNAAGLVKAGANATVLGTINAGGFAVERGATVSVEIANDFDLPAELKASR